MALTDSFPGVSGAVDSTELRKNLAGLIIRDTAGVPRAGIFPRHANALVTARADMALDVAAFEGVSIRGGGPLFMANDGVAQSPALATAPTSNSRIDVLYFKQNENGYGGFADGVNTPVFGVATGTAAASPTKPSIASIAGATELATITIPSTATATNSSGVVITQTFQYTATTGGVVLVRSSAGYPALPAYGQQVDDIALGYILRWNGTAWKVVLEDTGWIDFGTNGSTIISGWVQAAGTATEYGTLAYRVINRVIHFRGIVGKSSGTINAGDGALTIAAAHYPAGMRREIPVRIGSSIAGAYIDSARVIRFVATATNSSAVLMGSAPID